MLVNALMGTSYLGSADRLAGPADAAGLTGVVQSGELPLVGGADVPPAAAWVQPAATLRGARPPPVGGGAGLLAERVDRDAADVGGVEVQDLAGGHQAPSWWHTGQMRRAPRRSQRCWLRAVASWNPHDGQDATHRPWSRCSAGAGLAGMAGWLVVAGWLLVVG
jgi:hypothetical protein